MSDVSLPKCGSGSLSGMTDDQEPRVTTEVERRGGRAFVSTGNAWERRYGYSRAVRVGSQVWVTGTLGVEADGTLATTAAGQARRAFAIINAALDAAGASPADVVRVRGYLTDIADIDATGDVFRERFAPHGVRPCLVQVAVAALANPEARVELEAEAVVAERGDESGEADAWMTNVRQAFERQRRLAELAAEQLGDDELRRRPREGMNSVAVVLRHLAGNLASRFDDFLASDGEKPTRDRDAEFADWPGTRAELMTCWDDGWATLLGALDRLGPADAGRTVTIRGEPHAVREALLRSLSHVAYHVGQVALLARLVRGGDDGWRWLTIPPGGSAAHNASTWGTAASRGAVGEGEDTRSSGGETA